MGLFSWLKDKINRTPRLAEGSMQKGRRTGKSV